MKTWTINLICITLSVMCLFLSVGYAIVSENFVITGTASVDPPEPQGLYISKVSVHSASGVSSVKETIMLPTSLGLDLSVGSRNASVTLEVTVHNKTDMTYWYLGQDILRSYGSNSVINTTNGISITTRDGASSSSTSFDNNDWVPPETERTFYVTYVFGSSAQGNISTLVNFKFGLNIGSFSDGFLRVLNDNASEYGYDYLASAFDENYSANGSTVIANLGDDKEIFDNLFGSSITVNVDGNNVPVTVVVERKNVDGKANNGDSYDAQNGPTGCEYTVYITVDDLKNTSGKATVYAVSYTCGADGVWYMIGELYEGKCNVETYENSNNPSDVAFDVESWRAVYKEYSVIGNLSYKVAYSNGERPEQYDEIAELMGMPDQSFFNRINNFANSMLTNACHVLYTYRNNSGQQVESVNTQNIANPGYEALKTAFDRLKPYLILDNGATNVRLDYKASALNRAELIPMLENIQSTYEYYLAVNSK